MKLPIVAYGDPVLRKKCRMIKEDHKDLDQLIANMYETMYNAKGVGLAAPQIGKALRLFVIDSNQFIEDDDDEEGLKQVFINAEMLEEIGESWIFEEGCLSIPKIREEVTRKDTIVIRFQDELFQWHEKEFGGLTARVIQHEYDHIEGILFTDYLKPLKRRLLKKRLDAISKGRINTEYKMRFPKLK